MAFDPQFGLWSRDTLSSSGGATYSNPGEFEIRGGVTKLIPIDLNEGTYSFNRPWDHVSGWHIDNTMDSKSLVQEHFCIYTGESSDQVGNIGSLYNSAFYTSGNSSAFATMELTYPLWNKIRGAAFYDWGFVNVDSWDFDPSGYSDNWGIGLRFDLPGFPLHLDYAWPITFDEELQTGNGRFNFLIGHTF